VRLKGLPVSLYLALSMVAGQWHGSFNVMARFEGN